MVLHLPRADGHGSTPRVKNGPALAGYGEPSQPAVGGWGLLLARRLCDGLELRTTSQGTVVQMSMQLPGSPHQPS